MQERGPPSPALSPAPSHLAPIRCVVLSETIRTVSAYCTFSLRVQGCLSCISVLKFWRTLNPLFEFRFLRRIEIDQPRGTGGPTAGAHNAAVDPVVDYMDTHAKLLGHLPHR